MLAFVVFSGFLLSPLAPWIARAAPARAGAWLALLPLGLSLFLLSSLPEVQSGPLLVSYPWVPALDIELAFLLDGLSLLFALLISFIGALVLIFAGAYMPQHPGLPRLYALLLAFMGSMLGLVLSDNLITLFVFWELTSITSYLLIGFDHEQPEARKAALQALLVTAGGGLAMLVGFILLGMTAETFSLSGILTQGELLREHALYTPLLILILLGAFTKSAQTPFHFWLPNAMAAPTPVSTYLHSATMVKAGVYLLARLHPALGGTDLWTLLIAGAGGLTLVLGAVLAVRNTAVKRVLAYSTVMALGTLTFLIGLGTEAAIVAAVVVLFAHSLYKGALFLVAGVLDHQTGCKDLLALGGLRRALPVTAVIAVLAALSLAGLPPWLGFIAKEALLEAALTAPLPSTLASLASGAVTAAAALTVTVALLVGFKPFIGATLPTPKAVHEGSPQLLFSPALLAAGGLLFGLFPGLLGTALLAPAAQAVLGHPVEVHLVLWHGFTPALGLSALATGLGLLGFLFWTPLRQGLARLAPLDRFGPDAAYRGALAGLVWLAATQTRLLQNGYLRNYLLSILLTTVALVGWTLLTQVDALPVPSFDPMAHEVVIALLILSGAAAAATTSTSLGAVALLGSTGFGIALIYVLFSAPDLGMTQVLVETLTVVLLVLVLYRLPDFTALSSPLQRLRDALVALAVGIMIAWLILLAVSVQWEPSISRFFVENSQTLAHGRNIVNVILVDFRALDTLGEIFVLALAAMGVYAMVKLRRGDH